MANPRPLPRRALLAATVALALLAGACSGGDDGASGPPPPTSEPTTTTGPPGTSPAPTPDPGGPDDPAGHASIGDWTGCGDGLECTTATVPRDWSDVDGETLDLALNRIPAEGEPIGSLLMNPGGPGFGGTDMVEQIAEVLPAELRTQFDVVGWDPRGTDGSEGIACRTRADWEAPGADVMSDDPDDVEDVQEELEALVDACERSAGDMLRLVGTRSTVRDLDALRGVLGDEQLTYVGFSYGTRIGLEYLRMYPDRVRAMVLDGITVPGLEADAAIQVQAEGFERAVTSYADDCADRPTCPLGDDALAELIAIRDGLADDPVPAAYGGGDTGTAARRGTVGREEMLTAVATVLYSEDQWPELDEGLAEVLGPEPVGDTLLRLRDGYFGRQPDGSWDGTIDANVVINCADQAERPDGPPGDRPAWAAELPFWGPWFAAGSPGCVGHPEAEEPLEPLAPGAITDVAPVVLIGVTNDPATPYEQTQVAQEIVEGSVHLTYEGDRHTVFLSGVPCIDEPVVAYLVGGTPPEDGLRC